LTPAQLEDVTAWALQNGIECLYFLASPDAPETWRLAEEAGFRVVDVRVELERPSAPVETGVVTRPATANDADALAEIARTSHGITRFYADPHFPEDRCDKFYSTWIRRSLLEGFAEQVLVVEASGSPVGYVTCHADAHESKGSIGLIAVSNDTRGRGLGAALTRAAVSWCHANGLERTTVVTQGRNVAAQRTFQRAGFITASSGVWFHWWRGP
jgi:ribosomal protein S18 acetylase RimI-like enzyme